jgi:UDP-2,3-diacylglucosamine pyrophosphatase LpxH
MRLLGPLPPGDGGQAERSKRLLRWIGSMEHVHETAECRRVRSLFISDVHLGSRFAQADAFLAFLEAYQPEFLYIVGDFIDGWSLRRSWYWTPTYTRIIQRLFDWASRGVTIRYAPGNHDQFLRQYPRDFLWVEIADEFIHESADKRRYLVLHGDQFDDVELCAPWLSRLGSVGYDALLGLDWFTNRLRAMLGREPWRLSGGIKARIKRVVSYLSRFEQRLAEQANASGCHGVICGHIHTPTLKRLGDIHYCNTGDWVENCSALLEFDDGELRLAQFCRGTGTITHHDAARSKPASKTPAAVSAADGDSHPSVPPVKLRT